MLVISLAIHIYFTGIREVRYALPIEENVSVTTFGGESKVVIHLTDKYDDVISAISK